MMTLLYVLACSSGAAPPPASGLTPTFDGADAKRDRLPIRLVPVVSGLDQITDIQFVPGSGEMIVLGKRGTAWRIVGDKFDPWFSVDVITRSEGGLLGIAFHPKFPENGRFYTDTTEMDASGNMATRVVEWTAKPAEIAAPPVRGRTLLEVAQPYDNHDAGQLQFGPDGMLYVGFGDGGSGGDPHNHGQDTTTLLGDMLRIDVNRKDPGLEYGIPADNPFVGRQGFRPEIWAYGLRNPWRYSFAPDGRLVIADVGQGKWEEVDIAKAGDNLGWRVREGRHCYEDRTCASEGMVDPIAEYAHSEGASITGGYVWTAPGPLAGRYLYGDFATGRIWALALPADRTGPLVEPTALGKFEIQLSTFGRGPDGVVYAADFGAGVVYRIEPAS